MSEAKEVLAELLAQAQDGYIAAFLFLMGEGGKGLAKMVGVPYDFVLELLMEECDELQ